jgi:uncharacterized protein YbjT (DUF2867 family)
LTGRPLRLAVIGATGWLGGLFVREALAHGHSITAVVREQAGAANLPKGVADALASIHDTPSLAAAIGGHDAVLSAYRTPRQTPELMLAAARSLINAARQRSVARSGSRAAPGTSSMSRASRRSGSRSRSRIATPARSFAPRPASSNGPM